MPIAGLTDGAGQLPVIGDLRKGAEHTQGQALKDLTYFRFTSPYPELEQQFLEAYGPEPAEVLVRLPYAGVDACLDAWYEQYTAGSMVRRCDGNACVWQRTERGIQEGQLPCLRNAPTPCGCKPVGRLHVILPVLGMLGTVTVRTTSSNDIRSLYSILAGLADPQQGAGLDLRSLPFVLRRVPREIPTPTGPAGKPVRRTKYLLDLQIAPDAVGEVIRALGTVRPLGALPAPQRLALPAPAPEYVDPHTGEILDEDENERQHTDWLEQGGTPEIRDPQLGWSEGELVDPAPVAVAPAVDPRGAVLDSLSVLPIPAVAWQKLGRRPDPDVPTLGLATVELLSAWAGGVYKTKEGRAFAQNAARMLAALEGNERA